MTLRRREALLTLLAAGAGFARAAPPAAVWPGTTWARREPADSGWSAAALAEADAQARLLGSDAVLVVHRGAIVHAYGKIAQPWNLFSVRKSVLSMLYGIHRVPVDSTLAELKIDDIGGLSDSEKTATVLQLLQARSGIYHPAAYEPLSMKQRRPERGSHAPGTFWFYNNWDFNALGTIFRQRTGLTVFEALDRSLAQPLQFEDFRVAEHTHWHAEKASEHPAYLIDLSARDLARLGLLMARGGRWNDREIVPADWVAESTRVHSTATHGWLGYGLLWWIPLRAYPFWSRNPGDVFFGDGNFGQMVFVDRARDLVIVHRTDGPAFIRRPIDSERVAPLLERLLAAYPAA
jgi:CubicO group peptidase (beta-lactamase class C family)